MFYDSAYLALSLELDAPLVTADAKFAHAMANSVFGNLIRGLEQLA